MQLHLHDSYSVSKIENDRGSRHELYNSRRGGFQRFITAYVFIGESVLFRCSGPPALVQRDAHALASEAFYFRFVFLLYEFEFLAVANSGVLFEFSNLIRAIIFFLTYSLGVIR